MLLEYKVDRTCFFEREVIDVPKAIVRKVAQAGGLLGLDFASSSHIAEYASEGKISALVAKYTGTRIKS